MAIICIKCVREQHLKKLIANKGSIKKCFICGDNDKCLDSEDNDFFQLVKTLVRFHFSEWDYNHHMGGDGYESLFYGIDNIFFVEDRAKSNEVYEKLVLSITEGAVYEQYDKGVSIFAGYTDGTQNMPLRSIKSDLDQGLSDVSHRLKEENYFSVEDEVKSVLNDFKTIAIKIFNIKSGFYRARIGVEDKKRSFSFPLCQHTCRL